uniref:Uncharacterized protein n=1 Tax=Arundo donax TaxID=35708 RepID=A0A0A9CK78_ARUDO
MLHLFPDFLLVKLPLLQLHFVQVFVHYLEADAHCG